ncbi:hemoglobin-binding protein A [Pasteurella canis]|uniref:Hemoglobin-binding protein A n=1 Tax=Pasteurella canis TaxID=753 RepID=A0A379ERN0_9PAST|nr:hemoglobin-binding protein A [Pasteurella canis]
MGWERHHIILPNSLGYRPFDYKERDLNTNTKQVNLDLTKTFSVFEIENSISYGGIYSKTRKEMINKAGYNGTNPTWWAERTLGQNFSGQLRDCKTSSSFNGLLCPRHEPKTSFLIPVETTTKSLYFADTVQLHDILSVDLGYRYDAINYQPEYIPGITPKIADDMVKGLFIPLHKIEPWAPSPYSPKYNGSTDPKYLADLAEWKAKKAENDQNAEKKIAYIAQEKKFKKHSYSLGATFDPLDFVRLQVNIQKALEHLPQMNCILRLSILTLRFTESRNLRLDRLGNPLLVPDHLQN